MNPESTFGYLVDVTYVTGVRKFRKFRVKLLIVSPMEMISVVFSPIILSLVSMPFM